MQERLDSADERCPVSGGAAVIRADHVYKRYRPKARQMSLRQEAVTAVRRFLREGGPAQDSGFWAIEDVSFEIAAGQSVALVGRNGSGKTTLLRVLAHITSPTRGCAEVRGRFAALIALGAGFNYERTGRENIFLNAAIQGVGPRTVRELIRDIIAFSELGEFVDVPVKRYSNGMVTRLGFSVAVHLFPDIIFIDEVLAVGDAGFQHKCIERIQEMRREGRTLLLVSHDPGTVKAVCDRSIWLANGRVQMDGPTATVMDAYEQYIRDADAAADQSLLLPYDIA